MEKYFLSYDDPNLEENFVRAKKFIPNLTLHATKLSIAESHRQCGNLSLTNMFMVIDSDAYILDSFRLSDIYKEISDTDYMYIFNAKNPINDLEYGHGAIKVFQRKFFNDREVIDFSTSFFGMIKHVKKTLNIHRFNSSAFHTWRTAFRECAKLSAGTIKNSNKWDDAYRLDTWCNVANGSEYSEECINGSKAGRDYGFKHRDDLESLRQINDFNFLKEQYVLASRSE